MLEGAVLLVGFGAQHLVLELGDFLVLHFVVIFQALAFLLIAGQGRAIGFQPAQVGIQCFFDLCDVFG